MKAYPHCWVALDFNAMTLEVTDYQYVRVRNVASVPAVSRFVDNRLNGYAGTPTVQRPRHFPQLSTQLHLWSFMRYLLLMVRLICTVHVRTGFNSHRGLQYVILHGDLTHCSTWPYLATSHVALM